jgi:transitional endoplasmic reticulum ATPase
MPQDDPLAALRAALDVSPTNVPLRLLVADGLVTAARLDEAEAVFKEGLTRTPAEARLKLGLADVYWRQGKVSAGIVVCEDLTKQGGPPAAFLLLARLLDRDGEADRAVAAYRTAIEADADLADEALAKSLGVHPDDAYDDGYREAAPAHGGVSDAAPTEVERPKITFADVGGMEAVKEEIRLKIIYPLQHADLYKAYGKAIGGGVLLYGPPGCGKTHLARATAGEVKAGFINVGLHDVLDMWVGNSEKRLNAIFRQARRAAPCVLFFDEVDALAASRTDFRTTNARHVINQFLSELDGVDASNEGVLILAATNAPWHMDSAFRRPGRFDRILFVPPPDATARAAIVQLHLAGKPQEKIDLAAVAKVTAEQSGADLKAVIDRAVEEKLKDAMKTGVPKPLTTRDLTQAAGTVKASTREWLADARNYAMYSNDGGQYDDLAAFLKLR